MNTIEQLQEQTRIENLIDIVKEHEQKITEFSKTSKLVVEIHTALLGNMKEKGIVTEHRENCEYLKACRIRKEKEAEEEKKSRIDWVRWIERLVATAGFAWLLARMRGH